MSFNKILNALVLVLFNSAILSNTNCFANDFGDQNCQIFLNEVKNISQGSNWTSKYFARVIVQKSLIQKHFKEYSVEIHFKSSNNGPLFTINHNDKEALEMIDHGSFLEFPFDFHQRDTSNPYFLDIIASVTNGIDTLYDNNFFSNGSPTSPSIVFPGIPGIDGPMVRILRYLGAKNYESYCNH